MSETISSRVKNLLKKSGSKQSHLAKKLGIAPQQLNYFLKSDVKETKYLSEIAEFFNVPEVWLQTGLTNQQVTSAPVLNEEELISLLLSDKTIDLLNSTHSSFIPISSQYGNGYYFAYMMDYELNNPFILPGDLVIFQTIIPLKHNLNNLLVMLYKPESSSLIVGTIEKEKTQGHLLIRAQEGIFLLSSSDMVLGIGVQIIHKLNGGIQ